LLALIHEVSVQVSAEEISVRGSGGGERQARKVRERISADRHWRLQDDRYWDIFIETAKETDDEEELLFRVTAYNRGPESAPLHIVPHVWFRNTWTWGHEAAAKKPSIRQIAPMTAHSKHWKLGDRFFQLSLSRNRKEGQDVLPRLIFTENDSNFHALYGTTNPSLM
jgi:hypothetical protein